MINEHQSWLYTCVGVYKYLYIHTHLYMCIKHIYVCIKQRDGKLDQTILFSSKRSNCDAITAMWKVKRRFVKWWKWGKFENHFSFHSLWCWELEQNYKVLNGIQFIALSKIQIFHYLLVGIIREKSWCFCWEFFCTLKQLNYKSWHFLFVLIDHQASLHFTTTTTTTTTTYLLLHSNQELINDIVGKT